MVRMHADGSVDAQTLAISIGSGVAGLFLIILCLILVTGKFSHLQYYAQLRISVVY